MKSILKRISENKWISSCEADLTTFVYRLNKRNAKAAEVVWNICIIQAITKSLGEFNAPFGNLAHDWEQTDGFHLTNNYDYKMNAKWKEEIYVKVQRETKRNAQENTIQWCLEEISRHPNLFSFARWNPKRAKENRWIQTQI